MEKADSWQETAAGFLKMFLLWLIDGFSVLPLRTRYALTNIFAGVAFVMLSRQRNSVRNNLRIIRGSEPRILEILRVFLEYGRYWAESADLEGFWKSATVLDCGPDFPPQEPCFLGLTFHIGNFELFGVALFPYLKSDFIVVAERLRPQFLADYFKKRRRKSHYTTVAHDDPRGILKVLADGKALGIVCDRPVGGGRGVETMLFGKPYRMPFNLMDYALRNGIAVYVAYCTRENEGLRLHFVKLDRGISFEEAVKTVTGILEEAIRRHPFQWHMLSPIEQPVRQ